MPCDNDLYNDCLPNTFFSTVENQWVSQYRYITNFSRCLSSPITGIVWREVLYDDGRRRYININSSVDDISANRVQSLSGSEWVLAQCPDASSSSSSGGLTNSELRASPVPVSITNATLTATNVEISNDVGNPIPVAQTYTWSVTGTNGNWTDRSSTITASAVAQQIAASNGSRKYLLFQNVSDTTMYLNVNATAVLSAPSLFMAANGGGFEWNSNGFVPTGAVSVICSVSGRGFTCKEA